MKPVTAILLGAGSRGTYIFGGYAAKYPLHLKFVAVAEPNEEKRAIFAAAHGISPEQCFATWEEALSQGKIADAAVICTQDQMHFDPSMKALSLGYHIMLEKPMATSEEECIRLEAASREHNRLLMLSHVLRYTQFWSAVKKIIAGNEIGKIVHIQLTENVGHQHMAHSYVRGNWRNTTVSSPIILAKSSHDLDILSWLIDQPASRLSSFGSLTHFREDQAPEGSTARCTDGCAVERSCPYSAIRIYLEEKKPHFSIHLAPDPTLENRLHALHNGPYGRCVYRCDNNVMDHQVVNLEFMDGATAAFTLTGFTAKTTRTLHITGTHGEIAGDMSEDWLSVNLFSTGQTNTYRFVNDEDSHGGGDEGFIAAFIHEVRTFDERKDASRTGLTSAQASLQSHLLAFAAEKSRLQNGTPVHFDW